MTVTLRKMKNILFLICAIALLTTGFVSVADACVDIDISSSQVEFSADQDNMDNANGSDVSCHVHCHSHVLPMNFTQATYLGEVSSPFEVSSDYVASSFIYGLKRPPRA